MTQKNAFTVVSLTLILAPFAQSARADALADSRSKVKVAPVVPLGPPQGIT
ncbi:MAG: hypothetical protein NTY19_21745 [Planctomycetota bacterium]|nr:hypothetical protein [Planctomycetota bacterium]